MNNETVEIKPLSTVAFTRQETNTLTAKTYQASASGLLLFFLFMLILASSSSSKRKY